MPGKYEPDIDVQGYSLWLVPPPGHLQHQLLTALIQAEIPKLLNADDQLVSFAPHVTLTSAIPKETVGSSPKAWLENLDFPKAKGVHVRWSGLGKGGNFFKKLFLVAEKEGLREIAKLSRLQGVIGPNGAESATANEWVEKEYEPHGSILYWDGQVTDEMMAKAEDVLVRTKLDLQKMEIYQNDDTEGWDGGEVWLVPTFLKIDEWKAVAVRTL